MKFSEKIKTAIFWKNTLKISLLFLITIIIISLVFNSFSSIIKFDMEAVIDKNFTEGKWKAFFLSKIIISLVYGMWMTSRNLH